MSKKWKKAFKEARTVITGCTFINEPLDAETLATIRAVARAAERNASALENAAKALPHTQPMLQIGKD